jgi:hypothetical protein
MVAEAVHLAVGVGGDAGSGERVTRELSVEEALSIGSLSICARSTSV